MKVAVSIWNGRVSPVMDTARQLLIVDMADGREISRNVVDIPYVCTSRQAGFMAGLGIDALICGAISRQLELMLAATGIRVCPWARGEVGEVVDAFSNGSLQDECFILPGCGRGGGRRRMGRRYRHRNAPYQSGFSKEEL